MRKNKHPLSLLLLSLALLGFVACGNDSGQTPDGGGAADVAVADQQQTTPDTGPAPTAYKMAAVQYSSGNYSYAPDCADDNCGVTYFMREAVKNGARLVVSPEAVLDQEAAELPPEIGDIPADDARWAEGTLLKHFSKLARELKAIVVFQLITQENGNLYNTSVALGENGQTLARHYKFQLFGGESGYYTPGPDLSRAFFDTPAGRAGLMICADAQCIMVAVLAGSFTVTPDCTQHSIDMTKEYFLSEKKPDIVLFSAFWTVGSGSWAAMNMQKEVAQQTDVWLVGSNNTAGDGRGGGIFKPGGELLTSHVSAEPGIIYGELPFK